MQKSYKDQTFSVPQFVIDYLSNIKNAIDKKNINKDTIGYNILVNIITDKTLTYGMFKKIKSLLESNNTEDISKTILGGIDLQKNKLYIFINSTLDRVRKQGKRSDDAKMSLGLRVRSEKKITENKKMYLYIKTDGMF
jgi:hypothetical protein